MNNRNYTKKYLNNNKTPFTRPNDNLIISNIKISKLLSINESISKKINKSKISSNKNKYGIEKYSGKNEKKKYSNKLDMRYNIEDINQKRNKYNWPWEKNKKKIDFEKSQNSRYVKNLTFTPIIKSISFDKKGKRKIMNKKVDLNKNQTFDNNKDVQLIKKMNNFENMVKNEAYIKFKKNQINRDKFYPNGDYAKLYKNKIKDNKLKRGY